MRVLLLYPNVDLAPRIHHGLASLSAVLKKYSHEVSSIVFNDKRSLGHLSKVKEFRPDIIGITSCTNQWEAAKLLAERVKRISPARVFAGGSHPTVFPECLSETGAIDGICRGEGERPLLEVVGKLSKGLSVFDTPSFWFRDGSGIVKNDIAILETDLDSLPMPDWSIFDREAIDPYPCFSFSRGCVYDCHYCINSTLRVLYKGKGPYTRMKSVGRAISEIKDKLAKYDIKVLNFDDDGFVKDRRWISDFCIAYQKEIALPFNYNSRPEDVTGEVCAMMKRAGARLVAIGIESGDAGIRKAVLNRHISDDTIVKAFETARSSGLKTCSFNMVGIPGEDPELFGKTVAMNRRVSPDEIQLSVFYPFPSTRLGEECREKGYMTRGATYGYYKRSILKLPGFTRREIERCYDSFEYLVYKDTSFLKALKYRVMKFISRHRAVDLLITPVVKRIKRMRFFEEKIAPWIR